MNTPLIRHGLAASLLLVSSAAALAGEPIVVRLDHSQIFAMARGPATVVVGNPSIADVTIEGKNVFLHARAFGSSNVLVLDDEGKQLADYDVTVQIGGNNNLIIFKAGLSQSYVCAPLCESTLHIGDDKNYFSDVIAPEQKMRNGIAMGQKDGEAKQPVENQQQAQ